MKLWRQGDVLFRQIRKTPKGEARVRKDGIVMHGEVTGHAHRLSSTAAAEVYDVGDRAYLRVSDDGVSIVHEEHAAIALPPGDYEITIQREYSPEEIRNVAD